MRGVIRFLLAEGVKHVESICPIQAQYGDNCLSRNKIYKWTDHFKKRSSVCDEERSGRPSASTENSIQAIEGMVRENRRITVDDIAEASICLTQ
jgi:transposase